MGSKGGMTWAGRVRVAECFRVSGQTDFGGLEVCR